MHRDCPDPDKPESHIPQDPHLGSRLTPEQREQIVRLHKAGYGTRRIAVRVGHDRKTVRAVLKRAGCSLTPDAPSAPPGMRPARKLDAYRERIKDMVDKHLTTTRILREIRKLGYTGSRTILADYVRSIRALPGPSKKARRRFETRPGEEMQVDWSPYTVSIAGKLRSVHAFSAVLHHSRKANVLFYDNERQSTLLEAHLHAFDDFQGVTQRIVYDRMATVVLGHIGRDGRPIWHPRFLDFSRHYGFEPLLCRPRDPDRKGTVEAGFLYLERDFVRASSFDSLEEMNARVRQWLDEVANVRIHGTTRNVPNDQWLIERPFLTQLPDAPFPVFAEELRQVDVDATLWVRGTPYTVPWGLADKTVTVRLYHRYFEVVGPDGVVAMRRGYVKEQDKGRLQIDERHYQGMPRRPDAHRPGTARRLEEGLLVRFPGLADLVVGIKERMKSFAHLHLRTLRDLAAQYGDDAFARAAEQAMGHRAYNAFSVRRLLERQHPMPPDEPIPPLTRSRGLHELLDDVDPGSLDDYAELDDLGDEDSAGEEDRHDQQP